MSNHPNRGKSIRFAVIQVGHCVFGTGHTAGAACQDAAQWLEPDENGRWTRQRVERELGERRVDGDLALIDDGDEEFGSYLKNQGGYEQRRRHWFAMVPRGSEPLVYCHGCGAEIASAAAHWHAGEPYCDGCEAAPAEE